LRTLSALCLATLLLLGGCAGLPVDYPRAESHALQDTDGTRLGRAGQSALQAHVGQNGFRPLPDGVDAMLARIHLAEAAERSLDLMYFSWQDDRVGRRLLKALLSAADRGVRVRLLLDDIGTKAKDDDLLALDDHPGVEVRLFNPVASRTLPLLGALSEFNRVNRRMHNKAFIADNQRAILGGRNVGEQYFDAHEAWNFEDLDVLVGGPVVVEVSQVFDLFWNAPMSYPIGALTAKGDAATRLGALRARLAASVEAERDSAYSALAAARAAELLSLDTPGEFWGNARLVFDDPSKVIRTRGDTTGHLMPQLQALDSELRSTLTIVSPYFVPGNAGVSWLTGLVERGLDVTVLTNSLASTDVPAVHTGYRRYREALVAGSVRLFELRPDAFEVPHDTKDTDHLSGSEASLHAKTFFFDRRAVFIGSLNLDPRSVLLNTEIGIVCESAPMTAALLGELEPRLDRVAWRIGRDVDASGQPRIVWIETRDDGVRRRTSEPEVSVWKKLGIWLLGLLPIESQL
jgi:putative cardiolipin synthase